MTSITDQKQILRKQILSQRRAFAGPAKEKADKHIFQHVTHHQLYMTAHRICIFVSMRDEPDTHRIIEDMLNHQKEVVVPKISGGTISLYQITSMKELQPGTLQILEPIESCQKTDLTGVDVIFVPGTAFGLDGTRIGMGKGYYDRLLEHTDIPTIGLAYAFQIFPSVPTTELDRRVDMLISDM